MLSTSCPLGSKFDEMMLLVACTKSLFFKRMCFFDRLPDDFSFEILLCWIDLPLFVNLISSHRLDHQSAVAQILQNDKNTTDDLSLCLVVSFYGTSISCKVLNWICISCCEHKSVVENKHNWKLFSDDMLTLTCCQFTDLTNVNYVDMWLSQQLTKELDETMALFVESLPNFIRMRLFETTATHVNTIFELSESSAEVNIDCLVCQAFINKLDIGEIELTSSSYNHLNKLMIVAANIHLHKLSVTCHTLWSDKLFSTWFILCPCLINVKLVCDVTEMTYYNTINNTISFVTNSHFIEEFYVMSNNKSVVFMFHKSNRLVLHGFKASDEVLEALFLCKGNFKIISLRNAHQDSLCDKQPVLCAIVEGSIMSLNMLRISNSDCAICVSSNRELNVELLSRNLQEKLIINIASRLEEQTPLDSEQALLEHSGYFNFHTFLVTFYCGILSNICA
jgi:hypothetical protein